MYIGELLRMVSDSFLIPVWASVEDGLTGKGESDAWVVKSGT